MIDKKIILKRAEAEGLKNILIESYINGFDDADKIEASLMAGRVQEMRKIFLENRILYLDNPEAWFYSILAGLKNSAYLGTMALYLQLIFMQKRLALSSEQEMKYIKLIEWLEHHKELNKSEQIAIFLQLNQISMQELYRSMNYLDNEPTEKELDNLSCVLAMEQYILLKNGHYNKIKPSPEISLDSVCFCSSAVTETSFAISDKEKLQADSCVASLLSWLYLHFNDWNVAEHCVTTFSKLPIYFYRSLKEFMPQFHEQKIETSNAVNMTPNLTVPALKHYSKSQNLRLESIKNADYLRQ